MFKGFTIAALATLTQAFTQCDPNAIASNGILTFHLSKMNEAAINKLSVRGFSITASHGIRLAVEGNPTTGFEWDLVQGTNDTNGVFDVCGDYYPDESNPMADGIGTGTGGTYYFTITAGEASGTGTFSIAYSRDWETIAPEDSFTIPVHVTGSE